MFFLLIIVFELAFPIGQPLEIQNVIYEEASSQPSCRLLKHRSLERRKVIREITYLMNLEFDSPVTELLTEDLLINNKLFLDEQLWDDPSTLVSFEAKVTPEMERAIKIHGYDQIYISVKGPGMTWVSHPNQLPEDLILTYSADEKKIRARYWIYISSYCQIDNRSPSIAWLGPEGDFGEQVHSVELADMLNP